MGLNINLFVHGVPMGQKIWGPKGDDEKFLSSFYGPKWEIPEVMKVDVMNIGGVTQCYYSFIKGLNVCDSQGRAGSYFALTIKINAFYADVQNMYNILKATYDKMCVGLCVQEVGEKIKYILSDFQNVDAQLKELEKHLLNYISEFSIENDIISLGGFSVNGTSAGKGINLFECSKSVATETAKKTGHLLVSPCFLSLEATKTIEQIKAKMQATEQRAQQELQLQQKSYQEKISTITQQSADNLKECTERGRIQLEQEKEKHEKYIAELKKQYENVDAEIESLKRKVKHQEMEILDWKRQYDNKEKENKNLQKQLTIQKESLIRDDSNQYPSNEAITKHKRWIYIVGIGICVILLLVLSFIGIHFCKGLFSKNEGIEKNPPVEHSDSTFVKESDCNMDSTEILSNNIEESINNEISAEE